MVPILLLYVFGQKVTSRKPYPRNKKNKLFSLMTPADLSLTSQQNDPYESCISLDSPSHAVSPVATLPSSLDNGPIGPPSPKPKWNHSEPVKSRFKVILNGHCPLYSNEMTPGTKAHTPTEILTIYPWLNGTNWRISDYTWRNPDSWSNTRSEGASCRFSGVVPVNTMSAVRQRGRS